MGGHGRPTCTISSVYGCCVVDPLCCRISDISKRGERGKEKKKKGIRELASTPAVPPPLLGFPTTRIGEETREEKRREGGEGKGARPSKGLLFSHNRRFQQEGERRGSKKKKKRKKGRKPRSLRGNAVFFAQQCPVSKGGRGKGERMRESRHRQRKPLYAIRRKKGKKGESVVPLERRAILTSWGMLVCRSRGGKKRGEKKESEKCLG